MSDATPAASAAPAPVADTAPVSDTAPAGTESEDIEAELDAALEEPEVKASAKEQKAAAKAAKKKYTAKVNGRQQEVEIDLSNDEEVLRYIQKAMASDEKFQESAVLRKNVEMLVNELKTNPRGVLSHPELGLDLKKFATDILNEEMEDMKKTPEQKELEKLKKELEVKTKKEQDAEERARQAEMQRLEEQAFKQFDDEITQALTSSTLPKSPYVVKRIADTMIEAVNLGYTNVGVKDIMPIVESQIQKEIQSMFETMPEEVMEGLIGANNLSRLRKKRLAAMKKPVDTANSVKATGQKSDGKNKEADKPVKFKDIFGSF
jgi:hypothetical protein